MILNVEWKCSDCEENNVTELEGQHIIGRGQGFVDECMNCNEENEIDFEVKTKKYRIE